MLGNRPIRDILDLLVEDVDGGLGQHHHHADHEGKGQKELAVDVRHGAPDVIAHGHKAHGDRHQKHHQADKGDRHTDQDLSQLLLGKVQKRQLQGAEKQQDQQQGLGDLPGRLSQQRPEGRAEIGGKGIIRQRVAINLFFNSSNVGK